MSARAITVPSFAKINLDLRIAGRRDDGFHDICTIFQTISLADAIRFEASDSLTLTCSDAGIPTDEQNLIIRAANELLRFTGKQCGATIHLEKNIPSPGGLGGGSSNAAVTLMALCDIWELQLSSEELLTIAAVLGSDVPFFFCGGTAIGTGRGTEVEPITDLSSPFMILITPDVAVDTAKAYSRLNAARLTKEDSNRILLNYRFWAVNVDLRSADLKNDFEKTVFAAFPEVERVKAKLLELGAVKALLSGSGASVFGIFDNQETRQTAMKALGNEANWRSFAVATVTREDYRGALNFGALDRFR